METFVLFAVGAVAGSFLGVPAFRYDGKKFLFSRSVMGGRSRCMHCGHHLRWFELVPVVSFMVQKGRCRSCGERIGREHFVIEVFSGLLTALVPAGVPPLYHLSLYPSVLLRALWVVAFLLLLLLAFIDIRLRIIPDEINVLLFLLGIGIAAFSSAEYEPFRSFIGPYAMLFGLSGNIWVNHLFGAVAGALCLALLVLVTRGRGMGMGDVKLAFALGALFGWPDVIFLLAVSFVIGAVYGGLLLAAGRARLTGAVPFGPFLAAGSVVTFFFGSGILHAYFTLFPVL